LCTAISGSVSGSGLTSSRPPSIMLFIEGPVQSLSVSELFVLRCVVNFLAALLVEVVMSEMMLFWKRAVVETT
jgi:TRAP-type C4-dicarboxylate transport system permease large subunit